MLQKVLPSLCELIGAYSLVFLRDQSADRREAAGPALWQTGRLQVPFDVCQQIVYELSGRDRGFPAVVNNWKLRLQTEEFCGVRSCIVVPVVSESLSLGWLIAVNKDIAAGSDSLVD